METIIKQPINKIPFKVSARMARLIGRENIASSKGAIIELVKNGYDADSKISLVYFNNKYSTVQEEITEEHFENLKTRGIEEELLLIVYEKQQEYYRIRPLLEEKIQTSFRKSLAKLAELYIIDAGEGMTQNIIRNHWMTIGTDNKATDVFTKSGRVKAGAKGIGRFALDKLGSKCEMITVFNPEKHDLDTDADGVPTGYTGYNWQVNWEDFEGDFKTIDSVNAELTGLNTPTLKEELIRKIPQIDLTKISGESEYKYGTILRIYELRDDWEDFYVGQVYADLEVLVPPKETGGFEIYVFSSLNSEKYGEVLGSVCDDFDYKIHAVADDKQNVTITVYRNEYDVELIDPELFNRHGMQQFPYLKEDFFRGYWQKHTTFSKLLPGFIAQDKDHTFDNIGVFDFTFYFLKRTFNTPDANRFFYRKFQSNVRKDWLDKFGGIKLFRDHFRVRPYGETNNVAFDWLGLGNRKANSPAGVAKEEGGYRVEPENVAGAVNISRLTNIDFEDKSSREGLQENSVFQTFKVILTAIIHLFEEDRAHIAREMAAWDDIKFGPQRNRKAAKALAEKILASSRERKQKAANNPNDTSTLPNQSTSNINEPDEEKELLAGEIERKDEEIEKLKEEQKVLRGLASSGIVLAAFSHDLSKLNDVFSSRVDKLKKVLLERISEEEYAEVEDRKNPFAHLEKFRRNDIKMQNWVNFSLGAARKDKRTRKQLFLKRYFADLGNDWQTVFENRGVTLDTSNVEDIELRVFEIDFDSIFHNLLVNSIDAFGTSTYNRPRQIVIKATTLANEIQIDYYDNGPGLSKDIENPDIIFQAMFTTKRDQHTKEEIGTGLGMWLVKAIVEENDGTTKLLFPEEGFGLRITLPVKYKR